MSVAGTDATGTATGATPGEAVEGAVEAATEAAAGESPSAALSAVGQAATAAPPLPRPVLDAWKANETLVLLFVRDGGIDDRLVRTATDGLAGFRDAAVFVVPAAKISRYAAITEGVGVDRVPALVVGHAQAPEEDGPDGLGQLRVPEPAERRPGRDRRRLQGQDPRLPPLMTG